MIRQAVCEQTDPFGLLAAGIQKAIDVDSFKAHDLALGQTVTVRQALLTSQRAGDTWRQKVQQLALVRERSCWKCVGS
jgi:hypothetical protein